MTVVALPDQTWVDDVGPIDGLRMVPWDLTGDPPVAPEQVRVVVPPYMGAKDRLSALSSLPRLDLVQTLTAGYEDVLHRLPSGARLANAAGVHDSSTAELAVALTLASLRGIPEFVAAQARGEWLDTRFWPALADRRVLILGYGSIGRAVAARLLPFEVELTAVASRAREGDDLIPHVHGVDQLPELLPRHEVVIVIVPLSDATKGLVGTEFLASLPDGALVVNVARGGVVDTEALVRETAAGRIRAALDVTDPEPLPAGHPLWTSPGVLISPHVGGPSTAFRPRAVRLLRRQLTAYATGGDVAVVHPG